MQHNGRSTNIIKHGHVLLNKYMMISLIMIYVCLYSCMYSFLGFFFGKKINPRETLEQSHSWDVT